MQVAEGARTDRSMAEKVALAAVSLTAVAVALVPGRATLGPVPIDAVTVAVPLAVVACAAFQRRLGAARIPAFPIEVPAYAFLGIAALGIPFSQAPGSSTLTLVRYVFYLALAARAAALAVRPANLRAVSWAIAGAGAASVVQGIWQMAAPSAEVLSYAMTGTVGTRVIGSFGNPNGFGEFLVLAIPVTLALALTERGPWRWVAAAVCLGQALALALTYSRGSWIALAVGVAVAALVVDWRWLALFLAGGTALLLAVPGGLSRLGTLAGRGGGFEDRIGLWRLALQMIKRRPVAGVGLGNYLSALQREVAADPSMLAPGVRAFTPHDSFLTIAAETGLAGGAAFLWLVVRALRTCGIIASRLTRDSHAWLVNAALTIGVVAFAANAITDNAFQNPRGATVFWIVLGLLIGNGAHVLRGDTPPIAERFAALWAMPRTGGRLLLDSRAGRLLAGTGAPAGTPDLEPWEVVRT